MAVTRRPGSLAKSLAFFVGRELHELTRIEKTLSPQICAAVQIPGSNPGNERFLSDLNAVRSPQQEEGRS
jgi:hypothetical protein